MATARYRDKRLERFFRSINDIASGYLGEAQLSGYKVVRIDTTTHRQRHDTESYVAGLWHHDRVGNRLKAFVFYMTWTATRATPRRWPSGRT